MRNKIKKGYPPDSEGAESEEEMITYDTIIEKLWGVGIVAHKSILVTQEGNVIENVWVYSDSILSGKLEDKISDVIEGYPVLVQKVCNRDEIQIKIV